jgi:hypothetical protein
MGKYDDILAGLPPPKSPVSAKSTGKYDDILAGLPGPEPTENKWLRRASTYGIHPIIESVGSGVGALASGTLAAPAGPLASALAGFAGGTAMYPPSHEAANAVDRLMGLKTENEPLPKELQTGALFQAGGKALGEIPGIIKGTVKAGIPVLFGPSRAAVAARLESPETIKNALSYGQLAERLPKTLKNIGTVIDKAYENAISKLRVSSSPMEGAVPVSKISDVLGSLQNELKVGETVLGSSDKAATQKLSSLISDVNDIIKRPKPMPILGPTGQQIQIPQAEAYLPEKTVQKVIQRIRKDINFDDKSASVTNSVLTDVSGQMDSLLKSGNLGYQTAMRPVSRLMKILNDAKDKFGLTKKTGEGLQASDQTISSMKTLPSERRGISQKTMERVKSITGEDYTADAKNRALAEQFVGGNTQGTRRVASFGTLGGGIGATIGYPLGHTLEGGSIGANLGALAGLVSDISGREIGASVVDYYLQKQPGLLKLPYETIARVIGSWIAQSTSQSQQGK